MRMHSSQGCGRDGSPKFRQVSESWKGDVGLWGVRTERPYPPSSTKANSNFTFSKSSRFSSATATAQRHRVLTPLYGLPPLLPNLPNQFRRLTVKHPF